MFDRALSLTRDLLAQLSDSPLASFEDADYFRKFYKKPVAEPIIRQPIPIQQSPPLPPPAPKPIVIPAPIKAETLQSIEPPIPNPAPKPPAPPTSLLALIAKIAPEFPILREIPSDEKAQKIANRWKTKNQSAPISILSFGEPDEHKKLLEQIAKAIDVYFGPARMIAAESIEKEKQWEAFLSVPDLKLIICCDYSLWQMGHLMKQFKEVPAAATRHLGKTPLFLLPDLSLYLKDPLLKRSLWKALCQTISSL